MSNSKQGRMKYLEQVFFEDSQEFEVDSTVMLRRNRLFSLFLSSIALWLARGCTIISLITASFVFDTKWSSISITDSFGKVKEIAVKKYE